MPGAMYAKTGGEWQQVFPEPSRPIATTLTASPNLTSIGYSWTAVSGAVSYELEFNGVVENVGNVTSVNKTGLTAGVTYTAKVRAKNSSNVRALWSNMTSTVPSAPFNAATGGTVTDIPNYNGTGQTWRVHTFTSGTSSLNVTVSNWEWRYLVVAGGGGRGGSQLANGQDNFYGGFGGAGGVITSLSGTLAVANHTVTVGDGGLGGASAADTGRQGANGGNSVLGPYTAIGGGGGGGSWNSPGLDGGSGGGGGGGYTWTGQPGGAGTAGQGYAGAAGSDAPNPGGGGGAGGAGGASGAAGAGVASTLSGSSVTYARGGGAGTTATANSGNGGVGTGTDVNGRKGSSGIVIVAYRIT